MDVIEVEEKTFRDILEIVDAKKGKTKGCIVKWQDSVISIAPSKVVVKLGDMGAAGDSKKAAKRLRESKRDHENEKYFDRVLFGTPQSQMSQDAIASSSQEVATNAIVERGTWIAKANSSPLKQLESVLAGSGNCIYCFAMTGNRVGHYLSKCPALGTSCHKCFDKKVLKKHDGCPAMDSLPANRGICYFCGLEVQDHADGTFGKPSCRTWANDKLKALGLIYWVIDEMYGSLKEKPEVARVDEEGNLDYASFFTWFFGYDNGTCEPNYCRYLLNILKDISTKNQ